MHRAAGIAHRVRVLTADKRLLFLLCQIFHNPLYRRVHLAFHIAASVVASVVIDSLVVNQAVGIQLSELLGHLINHASTVRLIAAGPDQDRRMVLIALVTGIHAIEHSRFPLRIVSRHNRLRIRDLTHRRCIPASMGLHIILRDHVESVDVAELIQSDIVRIMAGTDGIDIVPLHGHDVGERLLHAHHTSGQGTEFVAVDALKHNPLSV